MPSQTQLFDTQSGDIPKDIRWELPNLSPAKRISLDTETTGLAIWGKDKPVGISVCTEDYYSWYIPFGHQQGFNYDLTKVQEWAKDNLRDKDIDLANAKFDFNMLLKVGVDLESTHNRLHDVMHPPALLNPNRQDLDLDSLSERDLGKHKVHIGDLKKFPIHERDSAAVWWYACYDAKLTRELADHYAPLIEEKELQQVLDLEDALIFCVASMEREGCYLDTEKLIAWQKMAQTRYLKAVMDIYRLTGFRVEPTKPSDLAKLFNHLKIEYDITPTGQPSFTLEFLKAHSDIEPVKLAYEAKQLYSLNSKFLTPYANKVDSDGKIRYSLNQLKAVDNDGSKGAISGRFSASSGGAAVNGINPQQVFSDEKQDKIDCISDFTIRDLFIPANGFWLSADARQIEFRFFAHYSKSPRLLRAYDENPLVDFHAYVAEKIFKTERNKILKNMNFSKIYGVGIQKLADMYLKCSYEEAKEKSKHYDREFPEASALLNEAAGIAERRGFVKTILGRRRDFGKAVGDTRFYAALNAVIQGTAADYMKTKLLELYNSRKETGFLMRLTVHDEVDGDIPDIESAKKVQEILDRQAFPKLRVPILWETKVGNSWGNLKKLA